MTLTKEFRWRRFLNWFPLGLSYAFLYMGRYNLTVAKTSLETLMTKEDFGIIFGVGTFIYAFSMLINGPLVDRWGGRRGMLTGVTGSAAANLLMGGYLIWIQSHGIQESSHLWLRYVFSGLYGLNMYFQSFGAVSIVKVNSSWFQLKERGGFSGIFGSMISSGIFFAFTVNGWLLEASTVWFPSRPAQWVVFWAPTVLLSLMAAIEFVLLRDSPADAGLGEFDTGDSTADVVLGDHWTTGDIIRGLFKNPVIVTIALVEFCTGILRNGVMHWFPIYSKEVWALPSAHPLRNGLWSWSGSTAILFFSSGLLAVWVLRAMRANIKSHQSSSTKAQRGWAMTAAVVLFLIPFLQAGWGGILFVAGVIGGNVSGWVSDLFFQSRRAPSAGGLYAVLAVSCLAMVFVLAPPAIRVQSAAIDSGLQSGDEIVALGLDVDKQTPMTSWAQVATRVACYPALCQDSFWDAESCSCVSTRNDHTAIADGSDLAGKIEKPGLIPAKIRRSGQELLVFIKDPLPQQRAGDHRALKASPELPISPYFLGAIVFLMSLSVIGSHGLLSGTASVDFGGRKAVGTAVGIIDGFVYAGTAVQSIALGFLTTRDWAFWPVFLLPFAVVGFLLLVRIWNVVPNRKPAAH